MKVEIIRAAETDAEQILQMQKAAYLPLLEKYRDFETSPACETVEKIAERLQWAGVYYYWITADGERVGAFRVYDAKDGSPKRLSALFVLPELQNRGIAQRALLEAERIHGSGNWELETIQQEAGNCHLYEKLGYRITGEPSAVNDKLTLISYKK